MPNGSTMRSSQYVAKYNDTYLLQLMLVSIFNCTTLIVEQKFRFKTHFISFGLKYRLDQLFICGFIDIFGKYHLSDNASDCQHLTHVFPTLKILHDSNTLNECQIRV